MNSVSKLEESNFPESYGYFHRPEYLPGYAGFIYGYYHIKYNDITVSFYEDYVIIGLRDFRKLSRMRKITIKPTVSNIKLLLDLAERIIELDFNKALEKFKNQ